MVRMQTDEVLVVVMLDEVLVMRMQTDLWFAR